MGYTQSPNPPPSAIWTFAQLAFHLPLDSDDNSAEQQAYVMSLQAACVAYAENMMDMALLNRVVTATWNHGDWRSGGGGDLVLPRGPLFGGALTSLTDGQGNAVAAGDYEIVAPGNVEQIRILAYVQFPLTAVYTGGWGTSAASVPPDIAAILRQHVKTLYELRSSVEEKGRQIKAVPHSLDDFYNLRKRGGLVG